MAQKIADATGATVWAAKQDNLNTIKVVHRTSKGRFEREASYNDEIISFRNEFVRLYNAFVTQGTPVGDVAFIKAWTAKVDELKESHPGGLTSATFTSAKLDLFFVDTFLEPFTKIK